MKNVISIFINSSASPFRSRSLHMHAIRIGMSFAATLFLVNGPTTPAFASTASSIFRFSLPGGAAIIYGNASNPQAPLSDRSWRQAVFYLPNGTTFGLLPRVGKSNRGATEIEPPSDSDISPSGQYVVIGRVETGTVWTGPGKPESVSSREFCPVIEIRSGCITSDQTGEICGEGWKAGQPAQWGTDDETKNVMLYRDRPSASRLLRFISSGQPADLLIDEDSGADNVLRCDPLSSANREAYQKIAAALHAAGAHNDARLIDAELSKVVGDSVGKSASAVVAKEHRTAAVSVPKAILHSASREKGESKAYLILDDIVTTLEQSPLGWIYVHYINGCRNHLR